MHILINLVDIFFEFNHKFKSVNFLIRQSNEVIMTLKSEVYFFWKRASKQIKNNGNTNEDV